MRVEHVPPFASLYLTSEEIADLLFCVEVAMAVEAIPRRLYPERYRLTEQFARLNSLRTAFAEAGYSLDVLRGNDTCVSPRGHHYGDKNAPNDGLGSRCLSCGRPRGNDDG